MFATPTLDDLAYLPTRILRFSAPLVYLSPTYQRVGILPLTRHKVIYPFTRG
jgi:hypothetical protein